MRALEALRDGLRRREVYVVQATVRGDPAHESARRARVENRDSSSIGGESGGVRGGQSLI
jgi:hypothetical protein